VQLVVFSDDWGRHPSSCQHLTRALIRSGRFEAHWVNTVGTRRPGLNIKDLTRGLGKAKQWLGAGRHTQASGSNGPVADMPRVTSPLMWPGFRQAWQRGLNADLLSAHVNRQLGPRDDTRRVGLTTLPITADLIGRVDVDRWVYYCVDDFSVWPGLDSDVMQTMERRLVEQADKVVAVSQTLRDRIAGFGRDAKLLTHGIDLDHWSPLGKSFEVTAGHAAKASVCMPSGFPTCEGPVALFWGLIDARLDTGWCRHLHQTLQAAGGKLVLAGPVQSASPDLLNLPGLVMPGPIKYDDLPAWAAAADVLVMPYQDAPVTRAMQPLKLKEYLATGKPVVLPDLPSTRDWADAADVIGDPGTFATRVLERSASGLPGTQAAARCRLRHESWTHKAERFASVLIGSADEPMRIAA